MNFSLHRPLSRFARIAVLLAGCNLISAPVFSAQRPAPPASSPETSLAEALSAACRGDQAGFATHLPADNARAFEALPAPDRAAILKRFVLLDQPGKPLLSTAADGHTVVHCDASGLVSEMRLGAAQIRDNLAFIPVEISQTSQPQIRFGLVRENGQWKLLSMGLLLLDIPTMATQWSESDLQQREKAAAASVQRIAEALRSYQFAYGKLPEDLEDLGPPPPPDRGASPERAALLDAQLASGESGGYRFRYAIVPAGGQGDETERNKASGFTLAATPLQYGKDGKMSYFLDSSGTLRGADKHGAVATSADPPVSSAQH